jgi:hypothetical protein
MFIMGSMMRRALAFRKLPDSRCTADRRRDVKLIARAATKLPAVRLSFAEYLFRILFEFPGNVLSCALLSLCST